MMKKLVLLFLLTTAFGYSQTTDQEYDVLKKKSPFNKMYPKATAADAAAYFGAWNKIFTARAYSNERGALGSHFCFCGHEV